MPENVREFELMRRLQRTAEAALAAAADEFQGFFRGKRMLDGLNEFAFIRRPEPRHRPCPSKTRQVRKRNLAPMHVQTAELGAAMQLWEYACRD